MNAPIVWIVEEEREDGYALLTQLPPNPHQAFAKVVVQMQDDTEENPELLARLKLIQQAPQMADLLKLIMLEMPTIWTTCQLTGQTWGSMIEELLKDTGRLQ